MNGSTFEDFQPYMKTHDPIKGFCYICGVEVGGIDTACSSCIEAEKYAHPSDFDDEAYSPSLDTHFVPANGGSWRSNN